MEAPSPASARTAVEEMASGVMAKVMIFPAGEPSSSRRLSVMRGHTSRGNAPGPLEDHSPSSARTATAKCARSVARRRWPKWIGSKVPPKRPRGAFEGRGSAADVSVSEHDPLLRREAHESDGAARMKLVGRDADLGAQPVLEAVGEACRRVH